MVGLIQFEEKGHRYYLEGRELTSVTRVIGAVLKTDNPWWNDEHALRGTFVHKICSAIDAGNWDPETTRFPDSWSPDSCEKVMARARAYERFCSESGFWASPKDNELRVASPLWGIAGSIDKVGSFTKGPLAGKQMIVDIKTGAPTPAAILQLAIYDLLLFESKGIQAFGHVALHVRPNETSRPVFYIGMEAAQNRIYGMSAINLFTFMKREGMV